MGLMTATSSSSSSSQGSCGSSASRSRVGATGGAAAVVDGGSANDAAWAEPAARDFESVSRVRSEKAASPPPRIRIAPAPAPMSGAVSAAGTAAAAPPPPHGFAPAHGTFVGKRWIGGEGVGEGDEPVDGVRVGVGEPDAECVGEPECVGVAERDAEVVDGGVGVGDAVRDLAPHGTHAVAPSSLHSSVGHAVHVGCPASGAKVSCGHGVHDDALPMPSVDEPGAQSVHATAPGPLKVPSSHW